MSEWQIVDRGPGIPYEQHAKVLAPFQRLGDSPSPAGVGRDGVGLGLSIAQGFIDALNGTMTLDDTPGGGLTVTLSVPIAHDELIGALATEEPEQRVGPASLSAR